MHAAVTTATETSPAITPPVFPGMAASANTGTTTFTSPVPTGLVTTGSTISKKTGQGKVLDLDMHLQYRRQDLSESMLDSALSHDNRMQGLRGLVTAALMTLYVYLQLGDHIVYPYAGSA